MLVEIETHPGPCREAKVWAKQVQSLDLSKQGGFALVGPWLGGAKHAVLGDLPAGTVVAAGLTVQRTRRFSDDYRIVVVVVEGASAATSGGAIRISNAESLEVPGIKTLLKTDPTLATRASLCESYFYRAAYVIQRDRLLLQPEAAPPTKTESLPYRVIQLEGHSNPDEFDEREDGPWTGRHS